MSITVQIVYNWVIWLYIFLYMTPRQAGSGMGANQTSFKKGFDSRRHVPINSGLVAFHSELSELLRAQSLDAVTLLVDTMNNEKAALKLRIVAAKEILDRGVGRPVDRTVVATLDSATGQDASKVSTEELEAIVSKMAIDSGIIDAEFVEVPETKG